MTAATQVTVSQAVDAAKFRDFQKGTVALFGLVAFVEGFDATSTGYVGSGLAEAWDLKKSRLGVVPQREILPAGEP